MMKFKAAWSDYIHHIRDQELEIIIQYLNNRKFQEGLEVGAGDGYQSKYLKNYVNNLTVTELNRARLIEDQENIRYMICDAETINTYFDNDTFDLIFTSNLLEHLPNVKTALNGFHAIAKFEGISIHIIPSTFWALFRMLLFYPNIIFSKLDNLLFKKNGQKNFQNNLKLENKKLDKVSTFIPKPHGVSENCVSELFYLRKKNWSDFFNKTGFEIVTILKGPVTSGYGFGWDNIRSILKSLGFSSENIYILRKI